MRYELLSVRAFPFFFIVQRAETAEEVVYNGYSSLVSRNRIENRVFLVGGFERHPSFFVSLSLSLSSSLSLSGDDECYSCREEKTSPVSVTVPLFFCASSRSVCTRLSNTLPTTGRTSSLFVAGSRFACDSTLQL